MASKGTSEDAKESPFETSTKTSKTSTKEVLCAAEDSSETRETGTDSTCIVLFRPEARLNPDVLELIFRHLNFKELLAAELVCKQWKEVVDSRRLYKQLAKKICSRKVNIGFTRSAFQKQLRDVRRGRFKKKNKS